MRAEPRVTRMTIRTRAGIAVTACACLLLDKAQLGLTLFSGVETVGKRFGSAPVTEDFFDT
ncbi:MAG: hypothetical protein JWP66_1097 [Naasia sp.]|nr:hypothetical protein [Naasia sp.]